MSMNQTRSRFEWAYHHLEPESPTPEVSDPAGPPRRTERTCFLDFAPASSNPGLPTQCSFFDTCDSPQVLCLVQRRGGTFILSPRRVIWRPRSYRLWQFPTSSALFLVLDPLRQPERRRAPEASSRTGLVGAPYCPLANMTRRGGPRRLCPFHAVECEVHWAYLTSECAR
ncbi:hypothetical protein K466DRAFT_586106 [Polyporus arcularius HHB13444]|uniref:Uncharacterized protein n=1 Tax=Polyporus arcularius HHB13444 TaxID=1314778 RepID=A0A5C3PFV8_9APHY|nr:hypothetical protein K466DRAFT_586106 [Polyporus arcularius HHB13444]